MKNQKLFVNINRLFLFGDGDEELYPSAVNIWFDWHFDPWRGELSNNGWWCGEDRSQGDGDGDEVGSRGWRS